MSIEIEHVSFSYKDTPVLKDVSFSAKKGELIAVLGANGVGKSTLFQCISGFLKSSGRIMIDGRPQSEMSVRDMAKTIAYVPQSHAPAFNFSVSDMVLMGTTAQLGTFASPGVEQIAVARDVLKRLKIEALEHRGFREISGGEQQLVLIARALAQQAKILLMDEPTANLDYGNRIRVMTEIHNLTKDGYTVLLSTHNPDQAFLFADKIAALAGGEVAAFGAPKEVLTAELIQKLYQIDVKIESLNNDRFRCCVPLIPG